MRKVDVVYLYEHAARELDVACAVSAILREEFGVSVEIVQWPSGFTDALYDVSPRLVILPFCYTEKSYPRLLAAWRKSIFFNMTWEQIFYSGNKVAKTPRGEFALNHVVHHAWSASYASTLRASGISEDHIYLNGQPAYALYNEPYRRYFVPREQLAKKHGIPLHSRWVFFPENYNWAFYTQSTLEQFIRNGQSSDDVYAMREYCNKSLAETVRWCDEAVAGGNVDIILRPRPATSLSEFTAFVSRVLPVIPKKIHILQEESVRDWVLASDMVVSSYSTSLLEAAIAEKPVYILEPYPTPSSLKVEWHEYLDHIDQKSDFLNACLFQFGKNSGVRLAEWAQEQMMSSGDSIENLAVIISRLLKLDAMLPPSAPLRVAIPEVKPRINALLWVFFQKCRAILGLRKVVHIPDEYLKDYFDRETIRSRINRWREVLFG